MAMKGERRPKFSKRELVQSDSDAEDDLDSVLKQTMSQKSRSKRDTDDFSSISFGALNDAQKRLQKHNKRPSKTQPVSQQNDSDSEEESSEGGAFFEEEEESDDSSDDERPSSSSSKKSKKKSKHAPSEQSAKKPVSRIRQIPGIANKRDTTLYTDIRFDPAYGKSDLEQTRKNYAFLDDYRKKEIEDMQDMLRQNQKKQFLSEREVEELNYNIQSLKSRMDTLKNRDLEKKVLKDFKDKHGGGNFFLKRGDKRKLIQKAKFDSMKGKQREKVMERKRKKRLGKEFKQMEFM